MTNDLTRRDRPNRVPWPPIFFVGSAALAIVLGVLIPIHSAAFRSPLLQAAGFVGIGLGISLDLAAMIQMRRHQANILPHRAATALVTTGVFAWSRNPIYLGNTVVLLGAAFALANPWFLLAAALAAFSTQAMAILREEAHLQVVFGDAWRDYASRTPRWFGPIV